MNPQGTIRALIANDPQPDRDGDRNKSRVAEIWFSPEDEEDVKAIISGRDMITFKVMK